MKRKFHRDTRSLTIRLLKVSDFRAWRSAYTDLSPQRNKWDIGPREVSGLTLRKVRSLLKDQLVKRREDRFYDFAIFERDTGKMVGSVAVMDVNRGLGQSAYLGYRILNPYWGRGYAKQAVLAAIDIAFRDLRLHRIEAGIEPTNRRSIMLARSIGLRKEGLKRRAVFLRRAWVDLVMYSATCEEFGIPWRRNLTGRMR